MTCQPPRSAPAQQEPPADLNRVPTGRVKRTAWFREHQHRRSADGGCWYFASLPSDPTQPSGRFDLPAPEGTCYFGDSERAAAMERVGRFTTKHQPVPADLIADRIVTKVNANLLPQEAANLTSPRAGVIGVTGELFTMWDYTIPQQWALTIRRFGHNALLYTPRFTPGAKAVASFGPTGPHPQAVLTRTPLQHVLDRVGIRIAHPPTSTHLTILDPHAD